MSIHIFFGDDIEKSVTVILRNQETILMKLSELAATLTGLKAQLASATATIVASVATTNKGIVEVQAKIDMLTSQLADSSIPEEAVTTLEELGVAAASLVDSAAAQKAAADALDAIVPDVVSEETPSADETTTS